MFKFEVVIFYTLVNWVLNFALRKVVGEVDQRGSLVAADRLRFDFTSKGALKVDEVKRVETICEEIVQSKLKRHH